MLEQQAGVERRDKGALSLLDVDHIHDAQRAERFTDGTAAYLINCKHLFFAWQLIPGFQAPGLYIFQNRLNNLFRQYGVLFHLHEFVYPLLLD